MEIKKKEKQISLVNSKTEAYNEKWCFTSDLINYEKHTGWVGRFLFVCYFFCLFVFVCYVQNFFLIFIV